MFRIKAIRHTEISNKELDEIIKIKSFAWPYPYEKQLEWINRNITNLDLHMLLLKNNEPVAYLDLIDIKLKVDTKIANAYGVGNVCAIEKGKGYGNELMEQTNKYIAGKQRIGLLFCKKELVSFYNKHGWILMDKSHLALGFDNSNIETMVFFQNDEFKGISYKGPPF